MTVSIIISLFSITSISLQASAVLMNKDGQHVITESKESIDGVGAIDSGASVRMMLNLRRI